ncbi:hypothetical protein TNCV_1847281 [Trichonephila clavipes]|nr:hypothetical protein TNCV_1847281 [Trichonephila clavipes]
MILCAGRIIGKIEEGRKKNRCCQEFDIAHSVVSRLWKSFKTTGMCSRRHGGGRYFVLKFYACRRQIYRPISKNFVNRRATAQQVQSSSDCRRQLIWRKSGTAYRPENIQKISISDMQYHGGASIMINGRTRRQCGCEWDYDGQRYIDEVLLPHVRLSVVLLVINLFLWTTTQHVIEHSFFRLSRQRGYSTSLMASVLQI